MSPIESHFILLFRLSGSSMVLFLACPFRQVDAGVSDEHADCVKFAMAFVHCLFAAFDFLMGLDHGVGRC